MMVVVVGLSEGVSHVLDMREGIEPLSCEGCNKESTGFGGDTPVGRLGLLCQARIQMREVLENVSNQGLSRTNSAEMERICKG